MRYMLALLTLAALAACGGGEGPTDVQLPQPTLAIVSGDSQTVSVTDTLPFDAEVCAERGGDPVGDQLMDWRVLEDNAGEPFVTTTRTGADGCTRNRVIAGTRAHTHPELDGQAHMEVRWIEQASGEAIVEETIAYLVMPGVANNVPEAGFQTSGYDRLTLPAGLVRDQYTNPVAWRAEVDSFAHAASPEYGTEGARTLVFDSAGDAVVCITVADTLVAPALAEVSGDSLIIFSVQGDEDTGNRYGQVQPEDCR